MSRTWSLVHVIVLIAVVLFVLFVLALLAALGVGPLSNPVAWAAAGLAVFAASFLPWRTAP